MITFVYADEVDDDIGLSAERSAYLDYLRDQGRVDSCNALHFLAWFIRAVRSTVRPGRADIVVAAQAPANAIAFLRMAAILFLVLVCRLAGGRATWCGDALIGEGVLMLPYRAVWALTSPPGCGPRKAERPDWAYRLGTPTRQWAYDRPYIALVLRGDRPMPTDAWFRWFDALAANLNVEPTVLVYSGADYVRAQSLSHSLTIAYRAWFDIDHAEHERMIREVYARSAVVVSDRLHALIIGATEGAIPLAWVETSDGSIRTKFDAAGMEFVGRGEGVAGVDLPVFGPDQLTAYRHALVDAVDRYRHVLHTVHAS